ncbi:MAG: thrombospondin type 3 repeat-containing protein, partial [Candidatus Riflemargulisbacteria bacterium]
GDLKDTDGDGYTDLQEYLLGMDPTKKLLFPEIDNFENGISSWRLDTGTTLTTSVANTTDATVSWNYQNSMLISGNATSNYYVGGLQKDVLSDVANWSTDYKTLNMLVQANGQVGDRIKVKIVETDGDVWQFEQYIGDLRTWTYLGMLLDRFQIVAGSTGNGVKEFTKTQFIRIELLSATVTGNVKLYVDNINVSTSNITGDTDGDGIPNWFEVSYNLNVLVANTGDTDGDGWSDLTEYSARTNPTQWTPHFPLIDNFERVGYTWLAEGISATRNTQATFPTTSLMVTGIATNYFGGFVGSYIYNPLNTMPTVYKSLTMLINNRNGKVGDKIEMQFQDKDGDAFSFTQVLITADWKWYTFVLDRFVKKNSIASGNNVLNLNNLTFVGYSFISATQNGLINVKLDEIALSTVPTSDDTDGDGLPNWWEIQYGLSANVANINPSGDLKDTDGDGYTDLQEYLIGMDPTKKLPFPVIDNFELVNGSPIAGNWSKTSGVGLYYEKNTDLTSS